jgi:hypothetical protein
MKKTFNIILELDGDRRILHSFEVESEDEDELNRLAEEEYNRINDSLSKNTYFEEE